MLPELGEIKLRRKEIGLTQTRLAEISGVSQPLIAKIEAGKVVPSYENARRLFEALEKINREKVVVAREIMHFPLVVLKENDSIEKAISLMNRHGISQIPVLKKNFPVGTISEETLVEKISKRKFLSSKGVKVKDIMQEALPVVEGDSPIIAVSSLLNFNNAVLVREKGRIEGIIAKTELIKSMVKGKKRK